jgi:hypothetical protein
MMNRLKDCVRFIHGFQVYRPSHVDSASYGAPGDLFGLQIVPPLHITWPGPSPASELYHPFYNWVLLPTFWTFLVYTHLPFILFPFDSFL